MLVSNGDVPDDVAAAFFGVVGSAVAVVALLWIVNASTAGFAVAAVVVVGAVAGIILVSISSAAIAILAAGVAVNAAVVLLFLFW